MTTEERVDAALAAIARRPKFYHRDGTPIVFDKSLGIPAVVQWATYFELQDRKVRQTITPYGEKLSTVFLGMDHNFCDGPPHIFETMLFAPTDRDADREFIHRYANKDVTPEEEEAYQRRRQHIAKHFPHDQLQLRYPTEQEAIESHIKLRLQCLIPPRWRRLLCYEIGGDTTWE